MVISIGAGQPGAAWDIGPSQRPASYSLVVPMNGTATVAPPQLQAHFADFIRRLEAALAGVGVAAVDASLIEALTVPMAGAGVAVAGVSPQLNLGTAFSGSGVQAAGVSLIESLISAMAGGGVAVIDASLIENLIAAVAGSGDLAVTLAGGLPPAVGEYAQVLIPAPGLAFAGVRSKGSTVSLRSPSPGTTFVVALAPAVGGVTLKDAAAGYTTPEPPLVGIIED